jgi:hypothetical protein
MHSPILAISKRVGAWATTPAFSAQGLEVIRYNGWVVPRLRLAEVQ